ncbi:endonuclease Q family protein [Marinicrinis lubricantis]|uniref:Endonuclease Q family protein n=1 Tax=Marinicrinis lubricantis TaxID=2086470 RepID=A0ABW1ISF0_9BACL
MKPIFADLHIHIGRTDNGTPVKISGSRNLSFYNIAKEASERKGIELIGIIDCHSPAVQEDMIRYLDAGEMSEVSGGGIRYQQTTVLLGCELEVKEEHTGPAHLLVYFPDLSTMQKWTAWHRRHVKNITLSSQRTYAPAREIQQVVYELGGVMIPAHIFTPHKSLYGSCTDRLESVLDPILIEAVELGLSADTRMAGYLSELDRYPFITNSDAHSLGKIGREYNLLRMEEASFDEWLKALRGEGDRGIIANYGLNPLLGKYHRTYCLNCGTIIDDPETVVGRCSYCGSTKITSGVMDRIRDIADRDEPKVDPSRPPYHYQIPLDFIPGLGKRTLALLMERFGTEMNILHRVPEAELIEAVGEKLSRYIIQARQGTLDISTGGGGKYGKVQTES